MVLPKGPAEDTTLLKAARDPESRIVSNDRYRDRDGNHPEVAEPGQTMRGGHRDGRLRSNPWTTARPGPAGLSWRAGTSIP